MRYLWVLLTLLVSGTAQAIDCQTVPDCETLGYSKNEETGCLTDGYINCPFDTSYRKCVNFNCESLGFTQSDKSDWCASVISCKSDSAMTLCQKPCFATTYDELKDLAGSGECKIVTMKNDIVLPEDMTLTLAENTTIDGSGYGLSFNISGTKEGLVAFQLTKNSGLENINVHYKQTGDAHRFKFVWGNGFLHNVRFDGGAPALSRNQFNHLFYNSEVTVSGRFEVAFQDLGRSVRLSESSNIDFMNAQVSIKQTGSNQDVFAGYTIKFKDSEVTIDGGEFLLGTTNAILENTKFKFNGNDIVWADPSHTSKLILNRKADVSFTLKGASNRPELEINLSGTSDEPARLEINASEMTNTNIRAMNVYDTLVLNGVSYHPTKAETTPLSEVENSENWEKVSQ